MEHILSRVVMIIWMFVMLVLTSSYTASLSSMLTVQQLQPTITDVHELQKNGDYIGYHIGSFIEDLLKQLNFDESKMRGYNMPEDYIQALSKGSKNGGVSAIVQEIPYIKLFLAQHCSGYTMVGPIYKTAGFGFVFPKGSPLVADISSRILNVTEGDEMMNIEKKWFGDENTCLNQGRTVTSSNLNFLSFSGLFLITGAASTSCLFIFLFMFLYNNWHELRDIYPDKRIWTRLIGWFKYYNTRDLKSYTFKREKSTHTNGTGGISDEKDIESATRDELQNQLNTSYLSESDSYLREEENSISEEASSYIENQSISIVVTV